MSPDPSTAGVPETGASTSRVDTDRGDRAGEPLEGIDRTRQDIRDSARAALGVGGPTDTAALRQTLSERGVGWYTLMALGLLVIVDEFQGYAFTVLAPEISNTLGISRGAIAAIVSLKLLAISLASLPMAAYVQNRPHRAAVSIVTALAWSLFTILTGFVTGIVGLVAILLADGASTGSVRAVHQPLLMDSYPPEARVRAFAFYRGADAVGNVIAPLMVAGLTAWLAFTWRGVFLAMGLVSLGAALFAVRLRDPGFGRWDTGRVRELVRTGNVGEEESELEERTQLGFFEIVRRLFLLPTLRRILIAWAVVGVMIVPFNTFLFFFLDERWNMGAAARGLFFAFVATASIVALRIYGPKGEELFRQDPAKLLRIAGWLLVGTVIFIAMAAAVPVFALMVAFFAVAFSLLATIAPAFFVAMLSIVPPNMRPHASALAGIYFAGVGGFAGALLLGSVDRRFGIAGAIISVVVPGVLGGLMLRRAGATVNQDLDRMVDAVIEEEEVSELRAAGRKLPLLSCRGIDFSYGQLQVLFDVDFTVDDGEMVALLGTNGAGKSTLLRVVSGLGLPSSGSVRFRGTDITYLDAERRVDIGIVQIPGGKAVFGPLSVVDNLRLFGSSHGRDRKAVTLGIETSFEAFPRLEERRNQSASTLSGGEQQMLGLSQAFMLEPRLLLIDELSLGLAPAIVADLLDMVRRINSAGTAVVLVEQSVNVALSLVDHAYFMEKGEIRFDGPAEELVEREDLLRSVFLSGATAEGRPSV